MNDRGWVTWALIGLNILAFLATVLAGADPMTGSPNVMLTLGANHPPLTLNGEAWRLLTSMFLHWGGLHLAMNMLALWSGGRLVETWYGGARYALLYLGAGLAGGLASTAWHTEAIGAGASGAVFGVFGAIFVVAMLAGRGNPQFQALRSHLWMFLGYNAVFGFAIPQIDMAAHVGGFVGGALLAFILRPAWPWPRVLFVLALLCAAGTVVFHQLRARSSGIAERVLFETRFQVFAERTAALDTQLSRWVDAVRNDTMSETQFRERLSTQLLPAWKTERERLALPDALSTLSPEPALAALRAAALEYADARIAWLDALSQTPEPSEARMDQLQMRAQAAAQRLRELQRRPAR